jgi:hypothetical protein
MKLITLTLIFIAFSTSALASTTDCYENLTAGYQDSALFTQHSSNVYSNSSESLDEQMALNALNKTLTEQSCEISVKLEDVQCTMALKTTLCRIDLRFGYFLILKDYVDTVNLIFNRWD